MHGLIAVIISYFIGGFLTAGVIASLKRVDLSKKGSGNLGATNAFRVFGPFLATLVLLGDIAKGVLGVWVGLRLGSGTEVAALCGLAVIVGHNWPLFFGFQSGRDPFSPLEAEEERPVVADYYCQPAEGGHFLTAPQPEADPDPQHPFGDIAQENQDGGKGTEDPE